MLRCNTIYGIGLSGRGTLRAHFLRAQLFFITRLSTSYFSSTCTTCMYQHVHMSSQLKKFPTSDTERSHRGGKVTTPVVLIYAGAMLRVLAKFRHCRSVPHKSPICDVLCNVEWLHLLPIPIILRYDPNLL